VGVGGELLGGELGRGWGGATWGRARAGLGGSQAGGWAGARSTHSYTDSFHSPALYFRTLRKVGVGTSRKYIAVISKE